MPQIELRKISLFEKLKLRYTKSKSNLVAVEGRDIKNNGVVFVRTKDMRWYGLPLFDTAIYRVKNIADEQYLDIVHATTVYRRINSQMQNG
jgi:hypothetical protein